MPHYPAPERGSDLKVLDCCENLAAPWAKIRADQQIIPLIWLSEAGGNRKPDKNPVQEGATMGLVTRKQKILFREFTGSGTINLEKGSVTFAVLDC